MIDFEARADDHLDHFAALAGALHVHGSRAVDALFAMSDRRARDVLSQILVSSAQFEPDLLEAATREPRGGRTSDRGLLWLLLLIYDDAANAHDAEAGDA